jgi:cyanophycin synthetase
MLEFRELRKAYYRSLWASAADKIGAEFVPWEFGLARIERDGMAVVVNQSSVMLDSHLTLEVMGNKALTYELLEAKGCPLPDRLRFSTARIAEAERFLSRASCPVVVKPNSGTGAGNGVTTGIRSRAQLRRAARFAAAFDAELLIEEEVAGGSYRLLYLDGKLIDAIRRDPPIVMGDGRSSIRALARVETVRRLARKPVRALSPLRIDLDCLNTLASKGLAPASILPAGSQLAIKKAVNQNAASQNHVVLDTVHPETASLAGRVVAELGVRLAGVDIISPDISVPLAANGGRFGEINTTPGLHHHDLVAEDRDGPGVAEILLEHFFATRSAVFMLGSRHRTVAIEHKDAA